MLLLVTPQLVERRAGRPFALSISPGFNMGKKDTARVAHSAADPGVFFVVHKPRVTYLLVLTSMS